MLAKLSRKGYLVITRAVRQALGLRAGTRFHLQLSEGKIILEPMAPSPAEPLLGKYPDEDFLTDLEAEHRREIGDAPVLRV